MRPDKDRCHVEVPIHIFLSPPPPLSTNLHLGRRNSSHFASPPRSLPADARRLPDIFPFILPLLPRFAPGLIKRCLSPISRAHLFGLPGGAATACIPMWGRKGSAAAAPPPSRTRARLRRLPRARCLLRVVTSMHLKRGEHRDRHNCPLPARRVLTVAWGHACMCAAGTRART